MTLELDQSVTSEGRPAGRPSGVPAALRVAEGVELVGEYKDSGFRDAPFIVRRADGQTIQLPEILYRIAAAADGSRSAAQIGEIVSPQVERDLDAETIEALADGKLRPLGVLAQADGSSPEFEKADPLLALRFRARMVPARVVRAATTVLRPFFFTPVVVVLVAAFVALDVWLLAVHGIAPGVRQAIYQPALLVALFGGVVLATAWHELGHATACRYGGAEPGVMGAGIYIVWPAFYTDVTDAYRLDKRGRLRTDLGGVYFNSIFALGLAGVYALTGFEPLLVLVLMQNFAILQQLLPLLRLDGYYILTDLTGVPDLLGRIKPILRSLRPGADPEPAVEELKPWVRWVVTLYLLLLIPALAATFAMLVLAAPRVIATAIDAFGVRIDAAGAAFGDGRTLQGVADSLQLAALTLPALGMVYSATRLTRLGVTGALNWSAADPARRGLVGAVATAAAAFAAFTLWPNGEYRPIQPDDRGTLASGVRSLAAVPTGRPALTAEQAGELEGVMTERARRREERERGRGRSRAGDERPAEATATPAPTPSATASPQPGQTPAPPTSTPAAPGASAPASATPPTPAPAASTPAPTPTPTATASPTPTPTPTPSP